MLMGVYRPLVENNFYKSSPQNDNGLLQLGKSKFYTREVFKWYIYIFTSIILEADKCLPTKKLSLIP